MAKKVKVKLNNAGMKALLSGPEMNAAMLDVAQAHTPDEDGYEAQAGRIGGKRTRAFISATDWESYNDNARNSTLLRSIS